MHGIGTEMVKQNTGFTNKMIIYKSKKQAIEDY